MGTDSVSKDHFEHMLDLVKSTDEVDVLKETCEWLVNELMKQDVTERIQAEPHEQTDERKTHRNGYRDRMLKTRVGSLELKIPKLRDGTYFPEWLLERQQPAEQAILGTVMEAYINGAHPEGEEVHQRAVRSGIQQIHGLGSLQGTGSDDRGLERA